MKRLLISGVLALAAAGCTNPCVKLAEQICACKPTTTEKDSCIKSANDELANINLSSDAEDRCDKLVDGCDCNKLDKPEGMIACGLARNPSEPE